jgi:hypothetical protein
MEAGFGVARRSERGGRGVWDYLGHRYQAEYRKSVRRVRGEGIYPGNLIKYINRFKNLRCTTYSEYLNILT